MARDTSILTIPSDTSYLPIVGAYVRAAATQLGFDDADIGDIRPPFFSAGPQIPRNSRRPV